jgi:superoxide oxidase
MLRNSPNYYGAVIRFLHWGMALIIIALLAAVELHDFFPKGGEVRKALMATHFQIGLVVFLIVWLRIIAVSTDRVPPIQPAPPVWQNVLAKLVKLGLYLAMIVLPILGICMLQAGDRTVALLGIQLPMFVESDKELAKYLHQIHEFIGNIMIGLIAFHMAAAIWHHFMRRDNALLRLLPIKG